MNFATAQHGVFDVNGVGTGFTLVQPNKNANQYQPKLIHLNTALKQLELTSQGTPTTGSNYGTDNTMVDGLETKFNASTSGFTVTARLKGPLSQLNANYDTAGIFLGPDDDNYVKLVASYNSAGGGQALQFTDEQNATIHTVNTYKSIGSFANIQTLDLRLTGDAATGKITASYSVNGAAFVAITGTVTLTGTVEARFFNAAAIAGITATSHNNLSPFKVAFGHFEIDAGKAITTHPSVRFTSPASNAVNVAVNAPIEADLNLPNSALNAQTVTTLNVLLWRTSDKSVVPAVVNTSGGGDSIILTPDAALAPNTQYTFIVTSGVHDTSGATMVPFLMAFVTGVAPLVPAVFAAAPELGIFPEFVAVAPAVTVRLVEGVSGGPTGFVNTAGSLGGIGFAADSAGGVTAGGVATGGVAGGGTVSWKATGTNTLAGLTSGAGTGSSEVSDWNGFRSAWLMSGSGVVVSDGGSGFNSTASSGLGKGKLRVGVGIGVGTGFRSRGSLGEGNGTTATGATLSPSAAQRLPSRTLQLITTVNRHRTPPAAIHAN